MSTDSFRSSSSSYCSAGNESDDECDKNSINAGLMFLGEENRRKANRMDSRLSDELLSSPEYPVPSSNDLRQRLTSEISDEGYSTDENLSQNGPRYWNMNSGEGSYSLLTNNAGENNYDPAYNGSDEMDILNGKLSTGKASKKKYKHETNSSCNNLKNPTRLANERIFTKNEAEKLGVIVGDSTENFNHYSSVVASLTGFVKSIFGKKSDPIFFYPTNAGSNFFVVGPAPPSFKKQKEEFREERMRDLFGVQDRSFIEAARNENRNENSNSNENTKTTNNISYGAFFTCRRIKKRTGSIDQIEGSTRISKNVKKEQYPPLIEDLNAAFFEVVEIVVKRSQTLSNMALFCIAMMSFLCLFTVAPVLFKYGHVKSNSVPQSSAMKADVLSTGIFSTNSSFESENSDILNADDLLSASLNHRAQIQAERSGLLAAQSGGHFGSSGDSSTIAEKSNVQTSTAEVTGDGEIHSGTTEVLNNSDKKRSNDNSTQDHASMGEHAGSNAGGHFGSAPGNANNSKTPNNSGNANSIEIPMKNSDGKPIGEKAGYIQTMSQEETNQELSEDESESAKKSQNCCQKNQQPFKVCLIVGAIVCLTFNVTLLCFDCCSSKNNKRSMSEVLAEKTGISQQKIKTIHIKETWHIMRYFEPSSGKSTKDDEHSKFPRIPLPPTFSLSFFQQFYADSQADAETIKQSCSDRISNCCYATGVCLCDTVTCCGCCNTCGTNDGSVKKKVAEYTGSSSSEDSWQSKAEENSTMLVVLFVFVIATCLFLMVRRAKRRREEKAEKMKKDEEERRAKKKGAKKNNYKHLSDEEITDNDSQESITLAHSKNSHKIKESIHSPEGVIYPKHIYDDHSGENSSPGTKGANGKVPVSGKKTNSKNAGAILGKAALEAEMSKSLKRKISGEENVSKKSQKKMIEKYANWNDSPNASSDSDSSSSSSSSSSGGKKKKKKSDDSTTPDGNGQLGKAMTQTFNDVNQYAEDAGWGKSLSHVTNF